MAYKRAVRTYNTRTAKSSKLIAELALLMRQHRALSTKINKVQGKINKITAVPYTPFETSK